VLILLTNDDGIRSPGLAALADVFSALGRVVVVAPDRERSAVGHALTLHSPLRAEEYKVDWWSVDGTPTDCVNLGIHGLIKQRPDLVVSGINKGANLGDDLTYSGTVAAAMEATLMGVPSCAVSMAGEHFDRSSFDVAAKIALNVVNVMSSHGLPADTFLNVNVPPGVPSGIRLTRQGKRIYEDAVIQKSDPRGRHYYWIGAGELGFVKLDGTDFHALQEGFVSVTPLHLDMTNYAAFERMRQWDLESLDVAGEEGLYE
jgi:5'-nucleotidase